MRISPNLFGMALGLSGLAGLWLFAAAPFGAPVAVGDALALLATATWVALTVAYLRQGARQMPADARDAAVSPFLAAPVMSALLLGAALAPHAPTAARVIVVMFLVVGALLSGWLTGQWMTGGLEEETFGAAFFLPGVGIGFIGSEAASTVGLHSLSELYFGIGTVAWVLLSSPVLNRMFFRPRLAPALIPTMAMELAPPAIAGNAYFLIHRGAPDALLLGLAGYALVMVAAQLRLLPLYRALTFTPAFWSFTFPCAAMATFALRWLALEHPAGGRVYAWILLAAATGLIGAIAVRTILAGARGQLLPSGGAGAAEPSGRIDLPRQHRSAA